jgi:hypothetical protein
VTPVNTKDRLARAAAAYRATQRADRQAQRARAAREALQRAAVHLAPLAHDLRAQVHQTLAQLERGEPDRAAADRWALVRELLALKSEGASPHSLARELMKLNLCATRGSGGGMNACLAWVRKERLRWRRSGT